jgi:two-component system chemotaxis response regulator CheB
VTRNGQSFRAIKFCVMFKNEIRNIITIGASAGGIAAVSKLVAGFKKEFDAAVFIVIHISRNSLTEIILGQIQKQTELQCLLPTDGEEIQNGRIYLAPANHHMMLEKGKISVKKRCF